MHPYITYHACIRFIAMMYLKNIFFLIINILFYSSGEIMHAYNVYHHFTRWNTVYKSNPTWFRLSAGEITIRSYNRPGETWLTHIFRREFESPHKNS